MGKGEGWERRGERAGKGKWKGGGGRPVLFGPVGLVIGLKIFLSLARPDSGLRPYFCGSSGPAL